MEQFYLGFLSIWFIGVLSGIVLIIGGARFLGWFGWNYMERPFNSGIANTEDWADLATGRSGWIEIEQAWLRKAQEVYGVFCAKQADYGPTNIAVGGNHGITVRLGDKVSRLFELLGLTKRENTGKPANESIRDTMVDIGDYGIIGMIVLDGDWPGVEPSTVWGDEAFLDFVMDYFREHPESADLFIERFGLLKVAEQIAEDIGGEVVDA